MVVNIIIMLFTLFVLFSFKNRKKQIRFAGLNLLLLCGFIVLTFFTFDNVQSYLNHSVNQQGSELSTTYGIGMVLPIISIIFNFLAIRAIKKDEELVRSADRIR
jgi:amino acid transporter